MRDVYTANVPGNSCPCQAANNASFSATADAGSAPFDGVQGAIDAGMAVSYSYSFIQNKSWVCHLPDEVGYHLDQVRGKDHRGACLSLSYGHGIWRGHL
jgi:hypothetical protein